VFTADPAQPWAEAIAFRDGLITSVGSKEHVLAQVGDEVAVMVEPSGLICPAFHDAHIHLLDGSMFEIWCDLHDVEPNDYLSRIQAGAEKLEAREWLRGGGWSMAAFEGGNPDRSDLDAIAPDVPIYLTARDGHSAWVNSRALEIAGIAADTPDPAGGRIGRDGDGLPSGVLHETAMFLVSDILPSITAKEWQRALEVGQKYMHSLGIVGWQDAKISRPMLDAYVAAADSGVLRSRVGLALHFHPGRGLEQIDDFVSARTDADKVRLQAKTVKIFVDGVVENQTAALKSPYSVLGPDHFGEPLFEPARLNRVVAACTRAGFQVHFHAIGDWAVARALDACECSGDEGGELSVRHQIAHVQVVDPRDIPRFEEIGVLANIQPYWACRDEQMVRLCLPVLGEDRSEWQYPFESLRRSGATLAAGSDWGVSTPDPLRQIEVAHTRRPEGEPRWPPLIESESLSLTDALLAFTRGAAFSNHYEHVSGSLEPGKAADIVFLSRDFIGEGIGAIDATHVVQTIFDGETVYKREAETID
jgi:predicted amidohydrolase YtcJ